MERAANSEEAVYRQRRNLKLQLRTGIKPKLDFENPQWWTVEFLNHVEGLADPKRLAAAKSCVRSGKVIGMNVTTGLIDARVQGRRRSPYHVRLYSPAPTEEQMIEIRRSLSERAIYGALLLAGEMPFALKDIYASSGAALMPNEFERRRRLCSCPEQVEDCKHILAVLLVAAGVFDRDPFLLLKMRGLEKDDLLRSLTTARGTADDAAAAAVSDGVELAPRTEAAGALPCETGESALPFSMGESFYGVRNMTEELSKLRVDLPEAGDVHGSGSTIFDFPLWRGETTFRDSIHPYYESVKKFLRNK
jgi:uncharacterized Zn finger protein